MTEQTVDAELMTLMSVSGVTMKDFATLKRVAPLVTPFLSQLTDAFYNNLKATPATAAVIEGRLDALKSTHILWLNELFSVNDFSAFVQRQDNIGKAHVQARIFPEMMAGSMSFLRTAFPYFISSVVPDAGEAAAATTSILRVLDLCQFLVDRAYMNNLIATLIANLGINEKLLNRLINIALRMQPAASAS